MSSPRPRSELLPEGNGAPPDRGVAMAFGPGLTIEGALFRRV